MLELLYSLREFSGLTVVTIVFLVASGIVVASNRTVDLRARNAFLAVIIELFFIALADWFIYVTNGYFPEVRTVHIALITITFIVVPTIPITIAQTIFPDRSVRLMMVLVVVNAVFQVVNIFTGFIFWVDETNTYYRGPLYLLYMVVYSITALYLVVESVRAGRVYQNVSIIALLAIFICMMTGIIIGVIDPTVRMTWPSVSVSVVLYFLFYSDMVTRVDPLTKLLNRRSYEEALKKPILPCIAVVIDVNDFKSVNDTHGHAFGDEALEWAGRMIRRAFGTAGFCYRTGGDEFAVIVTKRLDDIDSMVADLHAQSEKARATDDRLPSLSVGYAIVDEGQPDIFAAFQTADAAMYQAKRSKAR